MSVTFDTLSKNPYFIDSKPGQNIAKDPLGYVDIGARGGIHDLVAPLASMTAVLGFEPDEAECEHLQNNPQVTGPWAQFLLLPIAVSDRKKTAELVLLSYAMNHSLLHPNAAFVTRYHMHAKWSEIGTSTLTTDCLDALLVSQDFKAEFIKLDTQGTEFEILTGAKKTLQSDCVAVVCEVAFAEIYKEQKLFSEVEMLLREQGFTFYGFSAFHTRSKKLLDKFEHSTKERAMYADAVFLKDPLPGANAVADLTDRKIYVLFTMSLLLEYFDFAWELAQATWLQAADERESLRIKQLILELSRLSKTETLDHLKALMMDINESPESVNVLVGGFVDQRRQFCNVDDVLGVSPLPETTIEA